MEHTIALRQCIACADGDRAVLESKTLMQIAGSLTEDLMIAAQVLKFQPARYADLPTRDGDASSYDSQASFGESEKWRRDTEYGLTGNLLRSWAQCVSGASRAITFLSADKLPNAECWHTSSDSSYLTIVLCGLLELSVLRKSKDLLACLPSS